MDVEMILKKNEPNVVLFLILSPAIRREDVILQ